MTKKKKKPELRGPRNPYVEELATKSGRGAHKDKKKESNKNKCRDQKDED